MKDMWKRDGWLVLLVVLSMVLCLLATTRATAQPEPWNWREDQVCPSHWYAECYPMDPREELRQAHLLYPGMRRLRGWEWDAVRVITRDGTSKYMVDILFTDGGAHGLFHFQPPDDLDMDLTCVTEVCWEHTTYTRCIDDPEWVRRVEDILYSPYSAALQLREWREEVRRAVWAAYHEGWRDWGLTVASSISNSTGVRGFRTLAEQAEWDPDETMELYMAQRPGSDHRRRRVAWLNRVR